MTSFCKIGMWSSMRPASKRHRFLWDAMILWISWPECCPALARKINKRIYRQLLYHMDELRRLALRHFTAGCWIVWMHQQWSNPNWWNLTDLDDLDDLGWGASPTPHWTLKAHIREDNVHLPQLTSKKVSLCDLCELVFCYMM
jgi:hypothetical protein